MGAVLPYTPHLLVLPLLLSRDASEEPAIALLARELGEIDRVGRAIDFSFTRYYEEEMGEGLVRLFFYARSLLDPARLPRIKLLTNEVEQCLARGHNRVVNIDPGLLCESRFVLATTKDSSHRIPIGKGIYAEVTLVYERGEFRPLEWTYPDYRSPAYRGILKEMRGRYRKLLRMQSGDTHFR